MKPQKITIKRISTIEPNVSLREISYDIYVGEEYLTTCNDVSDAVDLKAELELREKQNAADPCPMKTMTSTLKPRRVIYPHPMEMETTQQTNAANTNSRINVFFVRKPGCLDDVRAKRDADKGPSLVAIEIIKELTTREYDDFADNLLDERDWLNGRGGYLNHDIRRAVMVTAPNRTTLFVDPSGSAYARYVGFAIDA